LFQRDNAIELSDKLSNLPIYSLPAQRIPIFFYVDAKRLAAGYHRGHRGEEEIGNLGVGRE
jgi:hypothetical protein